MKKTRKIRLLAFILTLCMTLGALPLYVFADGTETELPEQITETTNENLTAFQLGLGEKSVAELENMTLSAADIPASISRETVEAKDHVLRLREQEADLNTVIFQNRDGGKTVYLFGSPVKYVDANGNIRDKSTTLVSENVTVNGKTYAHSATDNFFGQYYPTMPQNGVMLAFGPYTVEMKPVITGVLTLRDTVVADNKVTYNKVFGTGTSLVYTPTLNGVKEDIILQTYTGKSSFSFTIKTNGLAIIQDENDTFLADFEGNKVASLGDVIITDKVGKTTYGTMTVATKTEREEYTVTVNAPAAFLTSPTTVYPVTVDPTFVIDEYDPDGSGNRSAIDDLCIYNGASNPYSDGVASLGNYSCYGETDPEVYSARMLYKFNSDYSMLEYPMYYMSSSLMESASLHLYGHVFESDLIITAYECTSTWENGTSQQATSTLWNAYNEDYSSDTTVSAINFSDIEIDVTEIFSHWAEDDSFAEYGIMLMVNGEGNIDDTDCYYQLILRQTEHETSNTYFSIDYSTFEGAVYINNKDTGKFLLNNGTSTALTTGVYSEDDSRKWGLLYLGENKYTISLYSNVRQILGVSENSLVYGVWSVAPSDNFKWELTHTSTYSSATIKNVATGKCLYVNASGNISLGNNQSTNSNWRLCKVSAYVPLTSFSVADIVMEVGETKTPTITTYPANATWASYKDFDYRLTYGSEYIAINSTTYKIIGESKGIAQLSILHKATNIDQSIYIGVDSFINQLVSQGIVNLSDTCFTEDGFYLLKMSLANILNTANIFELMEDTTGINSINVLSFYDDWYIYAVESEAGYEYGLLKMREQEFDCIDEDGDGYVDADGDDAGVTISFVNFEYNELLSLISSNSIENSYNFLLNLNAVTGPGSYEYNDIIASYFAQVESCAAYLIANEYIKIIANVSYQNNVIAAPLNYVEIVNEIHQIEDELENPWLDTDARLLLISQKQDLERIPNALQKINNDAGYTVFDTSNNVINVVNPNNLTYYEIYAILSSHTGNVTFNSFAAEVQFHADALYDWKANVQKYYEKALRADMAIGEEYNSGLYDEYYNLDSDIVQAQKSVHGEN